MTQVNRRARTLATLAGASLLVSTVGLVTGLTTNAAVSAAPTGDCAQPYPVADLETGDEVNGLTVAKGTTPAAFTGEVLGVVEDGIASGLDMVMVDLTSPDLEKAGAVWAGMSGSPVYAADGRLIGAVSYGLSWGPSKIAGVTPFEAMDDYAAPSARARAKVDIGRADAKVVAEHAGLATSQAARGFKRLSVPMTVTGADPARIDKVAKRAYLRKPRAAMSGGRAAQAGPESIVAGGNLGASVSHGLINYSGVGTTTSVCAADVIGFGHPLAYLGATSATLHPAEAVYIQPDPAGVAFKVANLGAPAGVIDNDRMAAISGRLGAAPSGAVLRSTSTFGSRSHSGTSTVTVPLYLGEVSWYHLSTTNDRAVDGYAKGNSLMTWSVKGKDAHGAPFELKKTDRYPADWDLAMEGVGEVPDLVWMLSEMDGVSVSSVDATSKLVADNSRHRVQGIQRRAKGRWVEATGTLSVKAGSTLRLRAVLSGKGGTKYRPVTVKVPRNLKGTRHPLFVRGGLSHYAGGGWNSVSAMKKYVSLKVRNDAVVAVVGRTTRKQSAVAQGVSAPGDRVVAGQQKIRIAIK